MPLLWMIHPSFFCEIMNKNDFSNHGLCIVGTSWNPRPHEVHHGRTDFTAGHCHASSLQTSFPKGTLFHILRNILSEFKQILKEVSATFDFFLILKYEE